MTEADRFLESHMPYLQDLVHRTIRSMDAGSLANTWTVAHTVLKKVKTILEKDGSISDALVRKIAHDKIVDRIRRADRSNPLIGREQIEGELPEQGINSEERRLGLSEDDLAKIINDLFTQNELTDSVTQDVLYWHYVDEPGLSERAIAEKLGLERHDVRIRIHKIESAFLRLRKKYDGV